MFLVNDQGMTFHTKIIDLIYKLIFRGLKTLDFKNISYFSLVFASQMLVLEYYNEHSMLQKMLEFLLYKYLVFHVIVSLNLDFESLFISKKVVHDENSFLSNASSPQTQKANGNITFTLHPDVNVKAMVNQINVYMIDLINQIMLCRTKITDELIKVKVVDRAKENNPPTKDELKKRFFKIEEIRERKLIKLLMLIKKKQVISDQIRSYNDINLVQNFLVGWIIES